MEKTMQFILEQQAIFAANQEQVGERVTRLEKSMADMMEAQTRLETNMSELVLVQVDVSERVSTLETNTDELQRSMAEMARTQAHMNEVVAAMFETHRHTEAKLDAFIGVLERYISEDRNGRSNGGGRG